VPLLRHPPTLRSDRLRLRPFIAEDAPAVHELAGALEVADTSLVIPHPYSLAAAKSWIAGLPHFFRTGTAHHFALALRSTDELVGAAALSDIDGRNAQAELTFWVGVPWWRSGYATEAGREVIRFGFEEVSLNRVYGRHLARDTPSGNVLRKLGMKQEGVLRQGVRKADVFEDVVLYAVLREDAGTA
jgi:ribosomal-protein-alanine N-acetyltransferase